MDKLSRRSFLKGTGIATGVAIIGASPLGAAAADEPPQLVTGTSPLPKEPLVAYVSDVKKSEVTVLVGSDEFTYRDPALTKRLLKTARRHGRGAGEVA